METCTVTDTPVVRLDEICQEHFGLSKRAAYDCAKLNRLPVPAFRLRDSQKAPFVVSVRDLNEYIENQAAAARAAWERSQL